MLSLSRSRDSNSRVNFREKTSATKLRSNKSQPNGTQSSSDEESSIEEEHEEADFIDNVEDNEYFLLLE